MIGVVDGVDSKRLLKLAVDCEFRTALRDGPIGRAFDARSRVTLASCALLRESDRCSRPADGRTHRCEFGRTRGARYRIAAMLVGKRLLEWNQCSHRIDGGSSVTEATSGLPVWSERLEPLRGPSYVEPSKTVDAGCAMLHIL